MKLRVLHILTTISLVALAGCSTSLPPAATSLTAAPVPPTATPLPPTQTPAPTNTPIPPTATLPPPTETPSPPTATATPILPTATPLPATNTVCAAGCDFTTIQAALDDPSTLEGAVIEVTDPVHTEAGIVVNKDVTIRGLGAGNTIVQAQAEAGSANERVFHIEEGATVTMTGMTIRHGYPSSSPYAGGGIWNQGRLRLENSVVSHNTAADGGGIWNQGELTVTNCTISGNTADGAGTPYIECGSGGGINNSSGGRLTLINSTVSDNKAEGKSGGIHVACESPTTLINSTVSGNKAASYGGGIFIGQWGGLKLIDSTISDNRTGSKGRDVYIRGRLDYTNTVIIGCVIGGTGDYRGSGIIGVHNNTLVEDNDCK